jgi:hypothetical protein
LATVVLVRRYGQLKLSRVGSHRAVFAGLLLSVVLLSRVAGDAIAAATTIAAIAWWLLVARVEVGLLVGSVVDVLRRRRGHPHDQSDSFTRAD